MQTQLSFFLTNCFSPQFPYSPRLPSGLSTTWNHCPVTLFLSNLLLHWVGTLLPCSFPSVLGNAAETFSGSPGCRPLSA